MRALRAIFARTLEQVMSPTIPIATMAHQPFIPEQQRPAIQLMTIAMGQRMTGCPLSIITTMWMEMALVRALRAIFARTPEQVMSPPTPIATMAQRPFIPGQQSPAIQLMTIAMGPQMMV